jgi:hypothetical protein
MIMTDKKKIDEIHQAALDDIRDILIRVQDKTRNVGEIPRRFVAWHEGEAIWWNTKETGGAIVEPPSYFGRPDASDWPFAPADHHHLVWIPMPKLARNRP